MQDVAELVGELPFGMADYAQHYLFTEQPVLHINKLSPTIVPPKPFVEPLVNTLSSSSSILADSAKPDAPSYPPVKSPVTRPIAPTLLTDRSYAHFSTIKHSTVAPLSLVVSHAKALEKVVVPGDTTNATDLQQLLTSTAILTEVLANTSALLKWYINKANPIAYFVNLPVEILLEIFMILGYVAPPAITRWDRTNLGWLSILWSCRDLRMVMKSHNAFWAVVCTQLPHAHGHLRAMAGSVPLTIKASDNLPVMPSQLHTGTGADRRSLSNLLQSIPAPFFASVTFIEGRVLIGAAMTWLGAEHQLRAPGLPKLEVLELEAPTEVDDMDDQTGIAVYVTDPFTGPRLYMPNLRHIRLINYCPSFTSFYIKSFDLIFDLCSPPSECSRPYIANLTSVWSPSAHCLKTISLIDAIDDESEDEWPAAPLTLDNLQRLYIDQQDIITLGFMLSAIRVPSSCEIRLSATVDPSHELACEQMLFMFRRLLRGQQSNPNRLLLIRSLASREGYTRTEIVWSFDVESTPRILDCNAGSTAITIRSRHSTSWLTCLRMFAETLLYLKHDPVKTLILPEERWAWNIAPFHQLNVELARTLFIVGTVKFAWPLSRINWAIRTDTALTVPAECPGQLKTAFEVYRDTMDGARGFDMLRLE